MGEPASSGADIPSRWAVEVSASTTPLDLYPRPQLARGSGDADTLRSTGDSSVWTNLNGLWEWEPANSQVPPFGRSLSGSILVPFPVESCLSGVAPTSSAAIVKQMWYRLTFDASRSSAPTGPAGRTLLHFGAVDWQTAVYLNGRLLGNHTGGYDGFNFDITAALRASGNELLVHVFDPSDHGAQPNGKQRISAIDSPGGDTYTPSSGIWQTVWLEAVPALYISSLELQQASLDTLTVSAVVKGEGSPGAVDVVTFVALDGSGAVLAEASAPPGDRVTLRIPGAIPWHPNHPMLYDLKVSLAPAGGDEVLSYFGLRTFALGEGPAGRRPLLNGNFTFLAGFLDQSQWPDGQYTAPTDEALAFDVAAPRSFGLNLIRLHQKVNPERWYYHADRLGVVVFQDMVQKYGGASAATVPLFIADMMGAILGRGNHPSIVQYETFNEGDCWQVFSTPPWDVPGVVALARRLDPHRLVDTDSGGGANDLHIGDVNDVHSYPYPGDPSPSGTQYGMVGEFGGVGAFSRGKEWMPGGCYAYLTVASPADLAGTYVAMAETLQKQAAAGRLSASVYTQTTDLELECDGFLNYDRSSKFSDEETAAIKKANEAIIQASASLYN